MKSGYIFVFLLLYNCIIHLPFLNLPPCGSHVWRQCNTLAMSRNFANESMNILEPRIDRRNESNGITGSHFPLYEWGLASIYKVSGEHNVVHRLFSLVISTFGLLALFLIVRQLGHNWKTGLFASLIFSSIPQIYYDGINAMPDILALSLSLFSGFFILKNSSTSSFRYWLLAFITASLGGLVKFQFLIIPFSFLFYSNFRSRVFRINLASLILAIVPIIIWYNYAQRLTAANNLKEYGLWIKPIELQRIFETIIQNIFSDLPELIIGWPLTFTLLVLSIRYRKTIHKMQYASIYGAWIITFSAFYGLAIERMGHHPYYFISIIPLFPLILVELVSINRVRNALLIAVFFSNLLWTFIRIIPSRWQDSQMQIPRTFISGQQLQELKAHIPKSDLYIIGPDISGCIYFYFTETKGYSFEKASELIEMNPENNEELAIDKMIRNGAKVLICGDRKTVEPILEMSGGWHLYKDLGEFSIWSHQ